MTLTEEPTSESHEEFAEKVRELKSLNTLVADVACGGGFSVAVLRSGRVCTWGMWAHGRLGRGPIPLVQSQGMRSSTSKKIARYQLRPALIVGLTGAVSVSCGEAHTLCLLDSGDVLAWGQNSCGQIGNGPTSTGFLTDAFSPVCVPPFGNPRKGNGDNFLKRFGGERYEELIRQRLTAEAIEACIVTAGAFHSVVVDTTGRVYTWGARGAPCLGHQDSGLLVNEWATRINSIFSITSSETSCMVPFELLKWTSLWSCPRPVEIMVKIGEYKVTTTAEYPASKEILQVAAGDFHTAIRTRQGHLYLCGTGWYPQTIVHLLLSLFLILNIILGPAVPHFVPTSRILEDDELYEEELTNEMSNASPEILRMKKKLKEDEQHSRLAYVVSTFVRPSASWLSEICTRSVSYIAGGGTRLFVQLDEEAISYNFTSKLLRKLNGDAISSAEQGEDMTLASTSQTDVAKVASLFETRGKADCMILASGRVFLCHRALLAQRSAELRDMIVMESPTDGGSTAAERQQPIQILLPELSKDAARALIYFLYCDCIPDWCIGNVALMNSLARTGKMLHLPRLQLISERLLKLTRRDGVLGSGMNLSLELPPSTLARDMGAMVGDPNYADVRFIAEGKAIMAHRFILEGRCEYFQAMFRSGMHARNYMDEGGFYDVVVPGIFV